MGGGSSKSSTTFQQFPGLFDDSSNQTGQDIGNQLLNLSPGILDFQQQGLPGQIDQTQLGDLSNLAQQSDFFQPLRDQIFNPQFGPQTVAESNLIQQLKNQVGGANAMRGLGSPTGLSLAKGIAPALIGLNQQRTQNLQGAFDSDFMSRFTQSQAGNQNQLAQRAQDINQRGQTIQGIGQQESLRQGNQSTGIQLLLDLAQLSQPDIVGSQNTTSNTGIGGTLASLAKVYAAFQTGGATAPLLGPGF